MTPDTALTKNIKKENTTYPRQSHLVWRTALMSSQGSVLKKPKL